MSVATEARLFDAGPWTSGSAVGSIAVPQSPPAFTLMHPSAITLSPAGGVMDIITSKLFALSRLDDGWNGPSSLRPSAVAVGNYLKFLMLLGADVTLDAEPVAATDGAILIEWESLDEDRTIEFQADGEMWLSGEHTDETIKSPARAVAFFLGTI